MICERCGQKFDRNPNRWTGGRHRSHVKNCQDCRAIIRKETAMKKDTTIKEGLRKEMKENDTH